MERKFVLGYGYAANGNLTNKRVYDAETGAIDDVWTYSYMNHAATHINTTKAGARFTMTYETNRMFGMPAEPGGRKRAAAGNMTTQHDADKNLAKTMAYDSYNRIRQVTDQGTYRYDDQGFRVFRAAHMTVGRSRTSCPTRHSMHPASHGEERQVELQYPSMYFSIEVQRDSSGTLIPDTGYGVNNIFLNGVRIAATLPNGDARYYLTDQVDSVKVVVDYGGNAVTRTEYLPFGETWFQEGDSKNAPKYNSQELDKESGYYFYNARHYDPEIARFVTPDTIIDGENSTQGWNRYSYVHNNPIRYSDPTGHNAKDIVEGAKTLADSANKLLDFAKEKVSEKVTEALQAAKKSCDELANKLNQKAADPKSSFEKRAGYKALSNLVAEAGSIIPENSTGLIKELAIIALGGKGKGGNKAVQPSSSRIKTYQTYTKAHPETGKVYSGKTSGYGTPEQNIARRDASHHMNKEGYGPAELDKSSTNKAAIRGREQQLIDAHGGAESTGGTSGNKINSISSANPERKSYLDETKKEFK